MVWTVSKRNALAIEIVCATCRAAAPLATSSATVCRADATDQTGAVAVAVVATKTSRAAAVRRAVEARAAPREG